MPVHKANGTTNIPPPGDLPLHVRMADIALEQLEAFAPLLATALQDMQSVYMVGMRVLFDLGTLLEKTSTDSQNVVSTAGEAFEKSMPTLLLVQREIAGAYLESSQEWIRLLRRSLRGGR
jgi:hypothetical protein